MPASLLQDGIYHHPPPIETQVSPAKVTHSFRRGQKMPVFRPGILLWATSAAGGLPGRKPPAASNLTTYLPAIRPLPAPRTDLVLKDLPQWIPCSRVCLRPVVPLPALQKESREVDERNHLPLQERGESWCPGSLQGGSQCSSKESLQNSQIVTARSALLLSIPYREMLVAGIAVTHFVF